MPEYRVMSKVACALLLILALGWVLFLATRHVEPEVPSAASTHPSVASLPASVDSTPSAASAHPRIYTPFDADVDPISNVELIPATEILLADDEVVIAVAAFGETRAYVRRALQGYPERHVVHDELGSTPVAVTHCERTGCTRVLTAKDAGSLLNVRCGGWLPVQEMALLVGSQRYAQSSPDLPLADLPFIETTWKAWKQQHPNSLIYAGPLGAESD